MQRKSIFTVILLVCTTFNAVACSKGAAISPTPTPMPTSTAVPTAVLTSTAVPTPMPRPTATPIPQQSLCNAADFPTKAKAQGGPDSGFQYPPLTYYAYEGTAAGNEYSVVCSPGTPSSILAFLKHSLPVGGWTITSVTATTLAAQKPTSPPSGYCPSVNITVGAHVGYLGEWDTDFHPPSIVC